jgi:hypothetical protein
MRGARDDGDGAGENEAADHLFLPDVLLTGRENN